MKKEVGVFKGHVSNPWPCWCEITDGTNGKIRFSHKSISDLEYLVSQMKKAAHELLPDSDKHEI